MAHWIERVMSFRGRATPMLGGSLNPPWGRRFSQPGAGQSSRVAVTGISKNDEMAQVEFQWRWVPLNEVGSAVYAGGVLYESTVAFRRYDDGWRLMEGAMPKTYQDLDDALKNSQSAQ